MGRSPRGGAGGEAATRLAAPLDANSSLLAEISEVVANIQCHKGFRNIESAKPISGAGGGQGTPYDLKAFKTDGAPQLRSLPHQPFLVRHAVHRDDGVPVREEAVNKAVDTLFGKGPIAIPSTLEVAVEDPATFGAEAHTGALKRASPPEDDVVSRFRMGRGPRVARGR